MKQCIIVREEFYGCHISHRKQGQTLIGLAILMLFNGQMTNVYETYEELLKV